MAGRITKGSQAAHERAVKAAATRKRNREAGGAAPAFPKAYHATPTRHVTRDLKMRQTPAKRKHPYKLPASKKAVFELSNIELQRQFNYWWHVKGSDMPKRRNADVIVYELRDELRRRGQSTYGDLPRIQAHRAARGVRPGGKSPHQRRSKREIDDDRSDAILQRRAEAEIRLRESGDIPGTGRELGRVKDELRRIKARRGRK